MKIAMLAIVATMMTRRSSDSDLKRDMSSVFQFEGQTEQVQRSVFGEEAPAGSSRLALLSGGQGVRVGYGASSTPTARA